jgi:hypothetical protein
MVSAPRSSALLLAAAAALPAPLAAQHITLKTVPIPAGEQFELLPSRLLGMGSVHVAVDDPLLDPFSNPARGARLEQLRVAALPTFYGEASNQVGGRSLPLAVLVPGERLFGVFAFALQQVDGPRTFGWFPGIDRNIIRDNSSSNVYILGSAGTRLNGGRTAVGASVYHADLGAVDAVNLLYGRSFAIEQDGAMTELRLGLTHDFGTARVLDAVISTNRLDMTHDVWYADWTWSPEWQSSVRTWNELNEDHTITWGAHLRYTQPVGTEGVRIGAILTGNTKAHPKIPNYNIVNIPRDPGNSAAFNIGLGLSSADGPASFGVELVFEPARSHTWAYADSVIATPTGSIPAGGVTVDNQFRFANWNVGVGVEREAQRLGFQLGLRLRQIRYSLDQQNFLTETRRKTRESWMEWTPTWSGVVKFAEFDLRYSGRFTARGWPDIGGPVIFMDRGTALSGTDFIIGPTAPVDLPEFRVTTHRIMLSIPFSL